MDTSRLQRGKETLLDGADSFLGGQTLVPEVEIRLFRFMLGHDVGGPGPPVPILSLASLIHGEIVASRLPRRPNRCTKSGGRDIAPEGAPGVYVRREREAYLR